jgi:predicted outer membrane repeat protein
MCIPTVSDGCVLSASNCLSISIYSCNFYNLQVTGNGSALLFLENTTFIISGCLFKNNSAGGYGGAIYSNSEVFLFIYLFFFFFFIYLFIFVFIYLFIFFTKEPLEWIPSYDPYVHLRRKHGLLGWCGYS